MSCDEVLSCTGNGLYLYRGRFCLSGIWGFGIGIGIGGISVAAGVAAGGFALTASPFFKHQKGTKRLCPGVRHFAEAQCSLATVSIRGHRLRFASLHLLSMCAASPHGAARLPPRMNTSARPADGAKDQKPKQDQKLDQEPLTLALSQRERGLIEVFGRATPTCNTALNTNFEKLTIGSLSLGRGLG